MTDLTSRYGTWAVITGASNGIGREFAVQLAAIGMNVVIAGRDEGRLEQLARSIRDEFGVEAVAAPGDLSTTAAIEELLEVASKFDVGLLIANAGFGTSGSFAESDLEGELDMLNVNCRALFALTQQFTKRFAGRKRSGIVLLSSIVAFQGVPSSAHYSATKAYVQNLGEALHVELAPLGIDVLSVAPGPVDTGFAARAGLKMGTALAPDVIARQSISALGRTMTTRPGWLSRVLAMALGTAPRWARVRIMGQVMGGMTRHQQEHA